MVLLLKAILLNGVVLFEKFVVLFANGVVLLVNGVVLFAKLLNGEHGVPDGQLSNPS